MTAMEVIQIFLVMFRSYSFNYTPVLPMWEKDLPENFKGYLFLLQSCSIVGGPIW